MKKGKYIFIVAVALILCNTASVFAETLTLAKNGKTKYVIVLGDSPTLVEQSAAEELKEHLDAVTGANFPIVRESKASASLKLFVGNSQTVRKLLPGIQAEQLPYDAIVVKTSGKNLIFLGHPQRGTLYAVHSFLENSVGVRWWTSSESFIPQKPTLKVAVTDIEYAPKLIYREAFYKGAFSGRFPDFWHDQEATKDRGLFAARMKCNGHFSHTTPEFGGHQTFAGFVHTFNSLIPTDKYYDAHPDWFCEINGKRVKPASTHASQLCLTNEELRKELTANALALLRKEPNARFISVSQNDGHTSYCQCAKCTALAEEEGSQSGPLIHFVNKVAEDIEKEFPDVFIETLAYTYTRKPPKRVKPRNNVVVRLCTIECSFAQPLSTGNSEISYAPQKGNSLKEDIEGWSSISKNLFIWDYVTDFSSYFLPHPNLRVLAPNIRFFIDNHTIGLFEQGDGCCDAGDFVRMRNWVISHLMWNPSLDEKELFAEFIEGYYGKDAAPFIAEYWKLLLDDVDKSNINLRCYMSTTSGWLTVPTLVKAKECFDSAMAATKDETLLTRLRRDRMPLDFVLLVDYSSINERAKALNLQSPTPDDPTAAVDGFFAKCKEFDVTIHRETHQNVGNLNKLEEQFRKQFPKK